MKFFNKMERKFGRYAISGLMRYIILINIIGSALGLLFPEVYYQYLMLDFSMILRGQIWRLITFILAPSISVSNPMSILYFVIEMYLYYMIGNSLEQSWGSFRFNLYYISGILLNILASLVIYLTMGIPFPVGLSSVYQSMFFAFAVLYPEVRLLLFYIIPIKVKWLGIAYGVLLGYNVVTNLMQRTAVGYVLVFATLAGIGNFIIFFFLTRNYRKISPKEQRRRAAFKREVQNTMGLTRHKCSVCGRTEQDDETLEFRFCTKCDGNYEYCMEHLFTHEHVKK